MSWQQLIALARLLATAREFGERRGRPQQVQLRKAISAAYYAMFHALAESNANTLIGASARFRGLPAWTQTYRALEHGLARQQINRGLADFTPAIQDFGNGFVILQAARHRADYDPNSVSTRAEALRLIALAETMITGFTNADTVQRRAFAAHVLFRTRTS